jgi:hypothetical protein
MSNPSAKTWLLTLNNPEPRELGILQHWEVRYLVLGLEVGEECGTVHLQGGMTFLRGYRLPQLKKLLPRAHWEIAKTPDWQNYCLKDGVFLVQDLRKKAKRSDLKTACNLAKDQGLSAVKADYPATYVRNWRGLQELIKPDLKPRQTKPVCRWIYGETGVGKTRGVFDFASREGYEVYVKDETDWWDGYHGQHIILFDDFRGQIKFNVLLRILDWYPYQGQVKGGYVQINSPMIYITSSLRPHKVYTSDKLTTEDSVKQLLRRLDYITKLKRDGSEEDMKEHCMQDCLPRACSVTFNNVFL